MHACMNDNLTIFVEQNHLEQCHFQIDDSDDQLRIEILKVSYINHVFCYCKKLMAIFFLEPIGSGICHTVQMATWGVSNLIIKSRIESHAQNVLCMEHAQ